MGASPPTPRTIDDTQRASCIRVLRERLQSHVEILIGCLHGSFHEGLPFRDVDVAVWVDPASCVAGDWTYAADLATELSRAAGLPVDVQVLNGAPLAFRYHALKGEPLVVRDEDFLADLRAATWDAYFDFQTFARQYWREVTHG